jgi:hypothetical protein
MVLGFVSALVSAGAWGSVSPEWSAVVASKPYGAPLIFIFPMTFSLGYILWSPVRFFLEDYPSSRPNPGVRFAVTCGVAMFGLGLIAFMGFVIFDAMRTTAAGFWMFTGFLAWMLVAHALIVRTCLYLVYRDIPLLHQVHESAAVAVAQ